MKALSILLISCLGAQCFGSSVWKRSLLRRQGRDGDLSHSHHGDHPQGDHQHHHPQDQDARSVIASGGYLSPQNEDDQIPVYGQKDGSIRSSTSVKTPNAGLTPPFLAAADDSQHEVNPQGKDNSIDTEHGVNGQTQHENGLPASGYSSPEDEKTHAGNPTNGYNAPSGKENRIGNPTIGYSAPSGQRNQAGNPTNGYSAPSSQRNQVGNPTNGYSAPSGQRNQEDTPSQSSYSSPNQFQRNASENNDGETEEPLEGYAGNNEVTTGDSLNQYDDGEPAEYSGNARTEYPDYQDDSCEDCTTETLGSYAANRDDTSGQNVPEYSGPNFPFSAVVEGEETYCPGGSLDHCIAVCPGSTARVYGACVTGCGNRCTL